MPSFYRPDRLKSNTASVALLSLGLLVALAGNFYQLVRGEHIKRDLALMQKNTQVQLTKLNDASAAMREENQQRFEAIKSQLQQAETSLQGKRKAAPETPAR